MVQEFLQMLPKDVGAGVVCLTILGALAGAALWLFGTPFSRYLVALSCVAIGTAIGCALPRWCGWQIDSMGPAVGGAVILGAAGYGLHRFWVGVGFGIVLMVWAALGVWLVLKGDNDWVWPAAHPGMLMPDFVATVWRHLPENVARAMPLVCLAAFIGGAAPAMVWPKHGMVLLYSSLGMSLLAGMGAAAVSFRFPHWINALPPKPGAQLAVLLTLVLIGATVQWRMTWGGKPAAGGGGGAPKSAK